MRRFSVVLIGRKGSADAIGAQGAYVNRPVSGSKITASFRYLGSLALLKLTPRKLHSKELATGS
jgi:hypothetical protein